MQQIPTISLTKDGDHPKVEGEHVGNIVEQDHGDQRHVHREVGPEEGDQEGAVDLRDQSVHLHALHIVATISKQSGGSESIERTTKMQTTLGVESFEQHLDGEKADAGREAAHADQQKGDREENETDRQGQI